MSFFSATVTIPVWFLVMLNIVMILLLAYLFWLVYRFKRGDIVKEEHSDMVVWKVKTRKPAAAPNKLADNLTKEKEHKKKEELVQVLKILLKEGEKGVMMQTIADRMGVNVSKADHAIQKLVDRKMVDEVVGVSGKKYYLTQTGKDYCRSKAR